MRQILSGAELPTAKCRWSKFSLRTLIVVTLLLSVALGYVGRIVFAPPKDATVVEKLYALGADIEYDYNAIKLNGIQPTPRVRGSGGRRALLGDYPETEISSVVWQAHGTGRMPYIMDDHVSLLLELPKLSRLKLGGPQLTDQGIALLASKTHIVDLTIEDTAMKSKGIESLQTMTSLKTLRLAGSTGNNEALFGLSKLNQLVEFELYYTQASAPGLSNLAFLNRLEKLGLYGDGVDDVGLVGLQHLPLLKNVTLFRTAVTGPGLIHLRNANNLEELGLWGSSIKDEGGPPLSQLQSLRTLTLRETQIGDAGAKLLSRLKNLRRLDLSFSKITDEALSGISRFESLEHLDVMYTALTDEGIRSFKAPTSLARLVVGPHVSRRAVRDFKRAFRDVDVTYIDQSEGFISIQP
jgi:hypothetical protein